VPELNEISNEMEIANARYLKKHRNFRRIHLIFKIKLFLLQNLGLMLGFFIMFILAFFSEHIKI
jgi:hypothetical protein